MNVKEATPRSAAAPVRLLVVSPFEDPNWRWHADRFPADELQFEFMNGNSYRFNEALWSAHAYRAVGRLKSFDGVVTFHPYMIFWVAFWMHVRGVRKPHFAWGLNHGNQRFFRGFYLWAARRVFREVDYFTVLSLDERDLFHKRYGIPKDKLLFRHWATAAPEVSEPLPEHLRTLQPYVCCIGRNNRDFETMFDAVRGLPISLIVVCPTYALRAFDVPDNAKVLCDLSLQECMEIIKGSVANIVAVRDNTTGAGHMTIVSGMHLGKAQIVTEVDKARDYFVGGVHGFWAKPRSSEDMRTKIVRLLEDDVLRQQFETNASEFGKKWVSEESSIEAARHDLRSWLEGKHPGATPPGWEAERKRLDELAGSTA